MKTFLFAAGIAVAAFGAQAIAQDNAAETYMEIEKSLGFVPTFMKEYPENGIRGAWIMTRDMEFSDQTALSPKVKSLINVAVAAQIPCRYCVYADTQAARAAGATDAEIKEAVGQAALTRHWSTILNGLQIDFQQFKAEFGGDAEAVDVEQKAPVHKLSAAPKHPRAEHRSLPRRLR
ncbi:carboxymuconolactone decarboxylase family protein [Rhodobacterales bacterium]|nr:carboxymuconolactone decarboxylase family protein [Rhodobacterales bacterium]